MMEMDTSLLVWEYKGATSPHREEWYLVDSNQDFIAKTIRFSKEYQESHRFRGPLFFKRKEAWKDMPQDAIARQLFPIGGLFDLSDAGTKSVKFDEVCDIEMAVKAQAEIDKYRQKLKAQTPNNCNLDNNPAPVV